MPDASITACAKIRSSSPCASRCSLEGPPFAPAAAHLPRPARVTPVTRAAETQSRRDRRCAGERLEICSRKLGACRELISVRGSPPLLSSSVRPAASRL